MHLQSQRPASLLQEDLSVLFSGKYIVTVSFLPIIQKRKTETDHRDSVLLFAGVASCFDGQLRLCLQTLSGW